MKRIWRSEEGVSPVIAVILMVGITVVLAAVLYVMVSGMMSSTNITPNVSMHWVKGDSGEYNGNVVSISGQQTLRLVDVTCAATVDGVSDAQTLDWFITGSNEMTIGNFTLDYIDNNNDNKLGGDDDFVVTGGEKGDIVRLIYNPTSGQMVTYTLR
jgi:flagellin-like protein